MLYAPSGGNEATAFGGTSSDVAVKENMVMLNKVESGGSITLNDGLWILKWEIDCSNASFASWNDPIAAVL